MSILQHRFLTGGESDPYWGQVTLLAHGNGDFADSSSYNNTPVVSGISSVACANAFGGYAMKTSVSTSDGAWAYWQMTNFADEGGAFTVDVWYQIESQHDIGGGFAFPYGEFFRFGGPLTGVPYAGENQIGSCNGLIGYGAGSDGNHTVCLPAANSFTPAFCGNSTGYDRVHVAWQRAAAGSLSDPVVGQCYINGYYLGALSIATSNHRAISLVLVGTSTDPHYGRTTEACVEEVRVTKDVCRYPTSSPMNIGQKYFDAPTSAFPNR